MAAESPSRNDGVTMRSCATCGARFGASGRRRHCSDACRQAAWRRRHQAPPAIESPAPPKGAKRAVTVYVCDRCDARSLGSQRCEECNVFMRALGVGGRCPCCDEAIAAIELGEGGGR